MPTYPSVTLTLTDKLNLHYTEYGERKLASQAWPRSPLANFMLARAKPYQGGIYISEALAENYTADGVAISEGSTLTRAQPNVSTAAQYQIKVLTKGAYLDRFRLMQVDTAGPMGPIVRLADEVQKLTIQQLRETFAQQLAAQTTAATANVSSIFDAVKSTSTFGGVDPTQFTWWASTASNYNVGAWSSGGVSALRTAIRESRKYTGFYGPDALFASKTAIDAMKAGGYSKTTFFRGPTEAKGYDIGDGPKPSPDSADLDFDGIPVWYDPHLDALEAAGVDASHAGGVILGLCSEAVFLRVAGTPFALDTEMGGPWKQSPDKWGIYADAFIKAQVCATNRNASFVLGGIS